MRFFNYTIIILWVAVISCREIRPPEERVSYAEGSSHKCTQCGEKVIAPSGAPVIPNRAIVTGTVQKFDKQAEQRLSKLSILIESTEDIPGKPNLLKGRDGELITFYSKESLKGDITGKRVRGEATYRGDESGGRWWISNLKVSGEEL